jgi:hypothetical protein
VNLDVDEVEDWDIGTSFSKQITSGLNNNMGNPTIPTYKKWKDLLQTEHHTEAMIMINLICTVWYVG